MPPQQEATGGASEQTRAQMTWPALFAYCQTPSQAKLHEFLSQELVQAPFGEFLGDFLFPIREQNKAQHRGSGPQMQGTLALLSEIDQAEANGRRKYSTQYPRKKK